MSSLPEELYLDILLMVPEVKSLLVCKCVCKKWYALISDPDFVKMHLDFTTESNNCSVVFQSNNTYSLYLSHDAVVELDFPCKYVRNRSTTLLGSCNGLVYGWSRPSKVFFLWNPATKEYKRLPKSNESGYDYAYHGFGYDNKTDDYKLVNIHQDKKSSFVQVYSLKLNSWKCFQSIKYGFYCENESGVLFNGALHWFGDTIGMKALNPIVSMDISEEVFKEMQLPKIVPIDQYYINMGVLEESLCVLIRGVDIQTFEVWVMQDYGVPDSWTKLYTITYNSKMNFSGCHLELIGSLKNGEILFWDTMSITPYDSKCETSRETVISIPSGGRAVKYFESLVSLNCTTAAGSRKKKQSTKILKKSATKKRNRELT